MADPLWLRNQRDHALTKVVNQVRVGDSSTRQALARVTGLRRRGLAVRIARAIELGYIEPDGEFGTRPGLLHG